MSLGPAMARGHSLRATRGVGPAVPLAAFPPLLPWGLPRVLPSRLMPHLRGCWSKISLWVKKTFAKRESLACPPQAGQESCPGLGRYPAASSPSVTTDCFSPLVPRGGHFPPLALSAGSCPPLSQQWPQRARLLLTRGKHTSSGSSQAPIAFDFSEGAGGGVG